jgi:RNA polymerase sigma factor (sigma-70 family)
MTSDLELLQNYADRNSEEAFAELVRRHLDLAYSAALRQVRSPQLAEEVAQSVFTDLARNAGKLKPDTVLTAWLYQVTRRTAVDVVRKESRRQLREQIATEMNAMNAHAADSGTGFQPVWTDIEPVLDKAMEALDDTDRAAVLLRYFENKTLREVGQTLGTSDDAAQKRVSRAVERLREFLSRRGVTVGASGLVVVISANAVQAAPAGLAVTISTAAVLAGTAVSTSTVITATKAIAMTTLQKTLITAALAVVAGAGIYEAHQAAQLREQNQTLQHQQAPLAKQIQQLQRDRDEATNRMAGLLAENVQLKSGRDKTELLKLRGEVGVLRQKANNLAQLVRDLQNVGKQNSSAYQTNFFPLGSLQFAGFATPEAALQSGLWAKSTGNEKVWLDGMAPDVADGAKNKYVQGKSDDERSRFLISQTTNWMGGRILNEIPLADDEVLIPTEVEVLVNGATNTFTSMEVLKKIDGEWKLFDEYNENGLKPKAP